MNIKKFWRVWARTMGGKISDDGAEADLAAAIRTFWWLIHITTCGFIIANTIRHW